MDAKFKHKDWEVQYLRLIDPNESSAVSKTFQLSNSETWLTCSNLSHLHRSKNNPARRDKVSLNQLADQMSDPEKKHFLFHQSYIFFHALHRKYKMTSATSGLLTVHSVWCEKQQNVSFLLSLFGSLEESFHVAATEDADTKYCCVNNFTSGGSTFLLTATEKVWVWNEFVWM